jgi:hypothetical protein
VWDKLNEENARVGQVSARSIVYLLFGAALLMPACGDRAMRIPNSVSDEKYSLYSAWVKYHFKERPPRLLLASRTFIFDPLGPQGCNAKILEARAHVSSSLVRALHDLGEAEYTVHTGKFKLPAFRIPWKYEESERLPMNPSPPFRLIAFSRVAFNRDRSEALFAVSNSCGGLCGGGGPLLAIREKGEWLFRSDLGCV